MAKKLKKKRRAAQPKKPISQGNRPNGLYLKCPKNARLTSLACTAIDDSLVPEDQQCG